MLVVALFAGVHFISTLFPYGIYIYLGLAVLCLILLWRIVFRVKSKRLTEKMEIEPLCRFNLHFYLP